MATMSCAGCGREQSVALDKNERCGFCRELDAACEAATERERGAIVAWLRGRVEARDEGTCPLTRVNAAISALLDAQRGPATGRPHTYWHGSPCSCSWGADHGNGTADFAENAPAPWALACVRALEAAPGILSAALDDARDVGAYNARKYAEKRAHVFRDALSLVPADVLAAAREETT